MPLLKKATRSGPEKRLKHIFLKEIGCINLLKEEGLEKELKRIAKIQKREKIMYSDILLKDNPSKIKKILIKYNLISPSVTKEEIDHVYDSLCKNQGKEYFKYIEKKFVEKNKRKIKQNIFNDSNFEKFLRKYFTELYPIYKNVEKKRLKDSHFEKGSFEMVGGSKHCNGKTKNGIRCKNKTKNKYCFIHKK